jgi:hypothetical protein
MRFLAIYQQGVIVEKEAQEVFLSPQINSQFKREEELELLLQEGGVRVW